MNKRKSRGAKYDEGEQVVCYTPMAAQRNGGEWAYQVQVDGTDRIETWSEDTMGRLTV